MSTAWSIQHKDNHEVVVPPKPQAFSGEDRQHSTARPRGTAQHTVLSPQKRASFLSKPKPSLPCVWRRYNPDSRELQPTQSRFTSCSAPKCVPSIADGQSSPCKTCRSSWLALRLAESGLSYSEPADPRSASRGPSWGQTTGGGDISLRAKRGGSEAEHSKQTFQYFPGSVLESRG